MRAWGVEHNIFKRTFATVASMEMTRFNKASKRIVMRRGMLVSSQTTSAEEKAEGPDDGRMKAKTAASIGRMEAWEAEGFGSVR